MKLKIIIRFSIILILSCCLLNISCSYFDDVEVIDSEFNSIGYEVKFNYDEDVKLESDMEIIGNEVILPKVSREGYNFVCYVDDSGDCIRSDIYYENSTYKILWDIRKYKININTYINDNLVDSCSNNLYYDIYLDDNLYKSNVCSFSEYLKYNTKVKVIPKSISGYNVLDDYEISVNKSNNININYNSNTYKSDFYYNNYIYYSSYNKYGNYVSVPSMNINDLGLSSYFYYISGVSPLDSWYQQNYNNRFNINVSEYNCTASFGSKSTNNANYQLTKVSNNGYNFCKVTDWGSIECTSNYSNVLNLYNNIWNILPRSGNGYSLYKEMTCDSGYYIYNTR